MSASLVPANHHHLERALAAALESLRAINPATIEDVWDPWRCPAPLLTFLAYALSVDLWDDGWSEVRKRRAIADSPAFHRRKGTRLAVDMAIEASGVDVEFSEWWEALPKRRRGTARALVPILTPDAQAAVRRVRQFLYAAKPKSRAIHVGLGEWAEGTLFVGGGLFAAAAVVIEPYVTPLENPNGPVFFGGALHSDMTIIISEVSP